MVAQMKIEITENGWKETIVKYIKVASIGRALMTVEKWVESNKRLGFKSLKRKSCNMCKTPWEELDGCVNLVFCTDGNKMLCDECINTLNKEQKKQQKIKRYKALEL